MSNVASGEADTVRLTPRRGRSVVEVSAALGLTVPTDTANGAIIEAKAISALPHRKRANICPDAIRPAPASTISPEIGAGNGSGGRGAKAKPDIGNRAPPAATISGQMIVDNQATGAAADGGATVETDTGRRLPLHPSTPALVHLQRRRKFAIASQQRIDRSCESFIASMLGFSITQEEKDRKAVFARAAKIRRAVEKGGRVPLDNHSPLAPSTQPDGQADANTIATDDNAIAAACSPIIIQSQIARTGWDTIRKDTEAKMRKLAATLPVWSWSEGIKGLGALGVAIIAAEAGGPQGDVSSYATKERLWKRLGLAVIDGERQRRVSDVDKAKAHGFNPKRRAEVWTIADSMFRHQWAGASETEAARPKGPYGAVYMRRKSHTADRDWNGMRKEADARRIMTKALIEDYWRVWRGLEPLCK